MMMHDTWMGKLFRKRLAGFSASPGAGKLKLKLKLKL
jgi:hypothetical protein